MLTVENPSTEKPRSQGTLEGYAKWGDVLDGGYQLFPDVLLKHQRALGLDATDVVVIANITMHWWYRTRLPFPRTTVVAKRMGVSVRTVQRSLSKLEQLGFVRKVRLPQDGGRIRTEYDFSPLVDRLRRPALAERGYRPRLQKLLSQKGSDLEI